MPPLEDRRAFDATNQPYRTITALVVAHLARDPRLAALIDAYRSQSREMREDDRAKVENTVAYVLEASGAR